MHICRGLEWQIHLKSRNCSISKTTITLSWFYIFYRSDIVFILHIVFELIYIGRRLQVILLILNFFVLRFWWICLICLVTSFNFFIYQRRLIFCLVLSILNRLIFYFGWRIICIEQFWLRNFSLRLFWRMLIINYILKIVCFFIKELVVISFRLSFFFV